MASAIAALIAATIAIATLALELLPPKTLTIAAGKPGTGYYAFAEAYREILAKDGIDLQIIETAGSIDNIAEVSREGGVDLALVQGGLGFPDDVAVEGIGTVDYEPVLIVHSGVLDRITYPPDWETLRIAIGGDGSGTRAIFNILAEATGLDRGRNTLLGLGGPAASEALLNGDVDVAIFVAPLSAPYLQPLSDAGSFNVAEILNSESLERRIADVRLVSLYRGTLDYTRSIPDREVVLLGFRLRLVAREGLHPAAIDRMVHAAGIVHGKRGLLKDDAEFPSLDGVGLPVDSLARSLVTDGWPPLADYVPYWVAAQFGAIAVLLLPLLLIVLPILRALPGLFAWRMRSRVFRHYRALAKVERRVSGDMGTADFDEVDAVLDGLDRTFEKVVVPAAYRDMAYAARHHTDIVRARVAKRRREHQTDGSPVSARGSG